MPLTDRSDFLASVNEEAFNGLVRLIQHQRPALFNYGTAAFAAAPRRWCHRIEPDPRVIDAGNPLVTVQPPIPVLGSPLPIGLNWLLQLTNLQIDFHPGNVIALPPELGRLPAQHFALRLKACFALDCPGEDFMRQQLPLVEDLAARLGGLDDVVNQATGGKNPGRDRPPPGVPTDPVVPPLADQGDCFCLELFAVLHAEWGPVGSAPPPNAWLKLRLDGLEIVDISPRPLENMIECYLRSVLRLAVLPRLALPLESLVLDIGAELRRLGLPLAQKVSLQPTAQSPAVPHNPSIEKDELQLFVDLVVQPA
jgi:hypothetical protein